MEDSSIIRYKYKIGEKIHFGCFKITTDDILCPSKDLYDPEQPPAVESETNIAMRIAEIQDIIRCVKTHNMYDYYPNAYAKMAEMIIIYFCNPAAIYHGLIKLHRNPVSPDKRFLFTRLIKKFIKYYDPNADHLIEIIKSLSNMDGIPYAFLPQFATTYVYILAIRPDLYPEYLLEMADIIECADMRTCKTVYEKQLFPGRIFKDDLLNFITKAGPNFRHSLIAAFNRNDTVGYYIKTADADSDDASGDDAGSGTGV